MMLFDSLENKKADHEKFLNNGKVDIEKVRKVLNRAAVVNLKNPGVITDAQVRKKRTIDKKSLLW